MFRYGHHAHHPVLGILLLVLLGALVAVAILAVIRLWRTRPASTGSTSSTPGQPSAPDPALTELRLRYARGEISPDELPAARCRPRVPVAARISCGRSANRATDPPVAA